MRPWRRRTPNPYSLRCFAAGGAVILDLGLPDRKCLELIGVLRAPSPAPIIIVTAHTEVAEKIAALDLGVDDYVTKPFDSDELLARLRSALCRAQARGVPEAETLSPGAVAMDIVRHTAAISGVPLCFSNGRNGRSERNALVPERTEQRLRRVLEAGVTRGHPKHVKSPARCSRPHPAASSPIFT